MTEALRFQSIIYSLVTVQCALRLVCVCVCVCVGGWVFGWVCGCVYTYLIIVGNISVCLHLLESLLLKQKNCYGKGLQEKVALQSY